MRIDFELQSDFTFEHDSIPLMVEGMSIRSGYIKKKHVIIPTSEMDNVVKSLKEGIDSNGAYILKDHNKTVDSAIGRVKDAWKKDNEVYYKGSIVDEAMGEKIRAGIITASSAGLRSHEPLCSICGEAYGTCIHILGRDYADEGVAEFAKEYYDEGDTSAAIFAKGLQVREQSMVLFPAVEGASAKPSFSFSADSQSTIDDLERRKLEDTDNLDATELIKRLTSLLENSEGFNKEYKVTFDDSNMANDDNETIVQLSSKVTTLEGELATKNTRITELEGEVASLGDVQTMADDYKTQLDQALELIEQYKDADKVREAAAKQELVDELVALRTERGMAEVDYADTPMETVKALRDQLKETTVAQGTQGAAGSGKTAEELAEEERKEDLEMWDKRIFAKANFEGSSGAYKLQKEFPQRKE